MLRIFQSLTASGWFIGANDISKGCRHCFGTGLAPVTHPPRPGPINPCGYCAGTGLGRPLPVRVFQWLSAALGVMAFVSLLLLAGAESTALRYPREPTGAYTVPLKAKCCIHYVTPDLEFYDKLAFIGFVGGGLACLFFMKCGEWLQLRHEGTMGNPLH
jgi:hypothetical protein